MPEIILKINTKVKKVTAILLLLVFTPAGQPTPQRAAVVYGGDLQEKIERSSASIAAYNAPDHWQETLDMNGSNAKVEINAAVTVPDVTAFPIYKVKQTQFDDVRIQPLVKYFVQGREVEKNKEPTKAELEEQLVLAKKDNDEEWVADLEDRISKAPESVKTEYITDWQVDQSPSGSFLTEDGEYAGIYVSPDTFIFGKGYVETEYVKALNDKGKIGEISVSKEDAIAAAQKVLHEIGIDYMAASSLEKAERYARLSNSGGVNYSEKLISKGYLIKFARNIDGIAGIINEGVGFNVMDKFAYTAPIYPEEIQMYVDETGKAQSFVWAKPLKIEDKLNENVALMPFDEIKQRICDMLNFINSYQSKMKTVNREPVTVTRVEMKMTLINVKDKPDEAMYVPSWFIYYDEKFESVTQTAKLVLNAIDGGRVLELPTDMSPEIEQQMEEDRKALNK